MGEGLVEVGDKAVGELADSPGEHTQCLVEQVQVEVAGAQVDQTLEVAGVVGQTAAELLEGCRELAAVVEGEGPGRVESAERVLAWGGRGWKIVEGEVFYGGQGLVREEGEITRITGICQEFWSRVAGAWRGMRWRT